MAANLETKPSHKPTVYLQDEEELKKVFGRFDSNGDGKISATEFSDVMKALGSFTSTGEVNSMMEEIDTDRDGFINLDEFANFCKGGSAVEGDDDGGVKELREAFDLYDHDKNGLISASELHHVLRSLGEKCTLQDCGRMIQSVDADGDGNVNFDEFKKMMTNGTVNGTQ